jgi:S1-C subfamily serine protease
MIQEKYSFLVAFQILNKMKDPITFMALSLLIMTSIPFIFNNLYAQSLDSNSSSLNFNTSAGLQNQSFNIDNSYSLPDLFETVEKSVVQITDVGDIQQSSLSGSRLGSGFVYDKNGHVITNYHVVDGTTDNKVYVTFLDGQSYEAEVVGADPYSDLAVIKLLNLNDDVKNKLAPLALGNSSSLRVGERVVAVGNPFGLSGSLTEGIVSGLGRLMPANSDQSPPTPPDLPFPFPPFNGPTLQNKTENPSFSIPDIIQTDAAINPGNSGGPLLNLKGQVIGINTAIFSNTGAYSGIGFAIPSNFLIKIIPSLIKEGFYKHPYIGVNGFDITPEIAKLLNYSNTTGFLVVNVTDNSPAQIAGIQGGNKTYQIEGRPVQLGGDIITKIDNRTVKKVDDILSYLENYKKIGDNVTITVLKGGDENAIKVLNVKLTERPEIRIRSLTPSLGIIGLDVNSQIAKLMNLTRTDGFLITGIIDKSPAFNASLRGGYILSEINGRPVQLGGDIITKIDNRTVKNQQDIKDYLSNKKIGDSITLTVLRDGKMITKTVFLDDFKQKPLSLDDRGMESFSPSPPSSQSPDRTPIPKDLLKDFMNKCYKALDKEICDLIINPK